MISDDGRGFDINSASTGLGLSGMAERMRDIHGTLRIESIPGNGTTITAAVSLQVPAEAKTDSAVR
jgi:signal transduction histidine kinase